MTSQVYGAGLTSDFDRFQLPEDGQPEGYPYKEPCPYCSITGGDGELRWEGRTRVYLPEAEDGNMVQCWECQAKFDVGIEIVPQSGTVFQWDGPDQGKHMPAPPKCVFTFELTEDYLPTKGQLEGYFNLLAKRAIKNGLSAWEQWLDDCQAFPFLHIPHIKV